MYLYGVSKTALAEPTQDLLWSRTVTRLLEQKAERKPQFHHAPDYFYAGFWIRFFAYLVDLACISPSWGT